MKLLVLLVVLALRRMEPIHAPAFRSPDRFAAVTGPLTGLAELFGGNGWWRWLALVAVPAVILGWLVAWLHGFFWGMPGWVAGAVLLFWLLGTESESRQVDDLLVRGRMNDEADLVRTAREYFDIREEPDDNGFFLSLYRRILHREALHLFATIFWVITLGYWAAILYVLNLFMLERGAEGDVGHEEAALLHTALFWLPGHLLILCMGLAGDWHRVSAALGSRVFRVTETEPLLEEAFDAAVDEEPVEPESLSQAMDRLETRQGLLLRCLAIWLLLAALWTLLVF